jgi:PHD/YefM family antitoxin component YafN of YafNO toxin-antitoxin module
MNTINASELKTGGVMAIESALASDSDVAINVKGKSRFVVLNMDYYQYLRECELEIAIQHAREDIAAGRFIDETAQQHKTRIMREYDLSDTSN